MIGGLNMAKSKTKEKAQGHSANADCGRLMPAKLDDRQKRSVPEPLTTEEKRIKVADLMKRQDELSRELYEINGDSVDGPPLNQREREIIEHWRAQKKSTNSQLDYDNRLNCALTPKTANGSAFEKFEIVQAALSAATGSYDTGFSFSILAKCVQASCVGENYEDSAVWNRQFNSITNALNALKPQDEFEGMLISRLIALHFQSIHYLASAANKESTTEGIYNNINRTTKLSRLYNETLEALMRYRRKGEQRVIVQHVQVNDGGQAIVGSVLNQGRGGGNNTK